MLIYFPSTMTSCKTLYRSLVGLISP
jgi:hypothetical protein